MATRYETIGSVTIAGEYQFDITKATLTNESGAQQVVTADGLAGFARGPGSTQLDISQAVSVTPQSAAGLLQLIDEDVNVQYFMGGLVWEFEAHLMRAVINGGVTQPADAAFTLMGKKTKPRGS